MKWQRSATNLMRVYWMEVTLVARSRSLNECALVSVYV